MKKVICVHHNDLDGICAAAIVAAGARKEAYGEDPDVSFVEADYGNTGLYNSLLRLVCKEQDCPYPIEMWLVAFAVRPIEMWIVDFSFRPVEMRFLQRLCKTSGGELIWIDHHKTAGEAYRKYREDNPDWQGLEGLFDTERAACELTWEYFYSYSSRVSMRIPRAVWLLGRYDVWNLGAAGGNTVLEFQYGMRLLMDGKGPGEFPEWLLDPTGGVVSEISEIFRKGEAVLAYIDMAAAHYLKQAFYTHLCGHKFLAVSCTDPAASLIAQKLWEGVEEGERERIAGILMFGYANGKWVVQLRSQSWCDVGEIAKQFGGGGHAKSAGFHCDKLPFYLQGTVEE